MIRWGYCSLEIREVAVCTGIVEYSGADVVGVASIGGRDCLMMVVVVGVKSAVFALLAACMVGLGPVSGA